MRRTDARLLQTQAMKLRLRSHTYNNIYSNRMLPRRKHPVLVCGRTVGNSVFIFTPEIFSRGLEKSFTRLINFPTVLEKYVASLEIYFSVLLAKNLRRFGNFARLVKKIGVHIFSF